MSFLAMVGGGLAGAIGWIQIIKLGKEHIAVQDQVAIWIQTFMYSILAIVSIFGFLGACFRKRSFVSAYSTVLGIHLIFSLITGIFVIWSVFNKTGSDGVAKCVEAGADQSITEDQCQKGFLVLRITTIVVFILIVLIEIYGLIIVSNYVEQLDDEEAVMFQKEINASAPHTTTYNSYGTSYPFSTPGHAQVSNA